jgi:hypothetical protein
MKSNAQVIDDRRSMRSLVDALAKLEEAGCLKEGTRLFGPSGCNFRMARWSTRLPALGRRGEARMG